MTSMTVVPSHITIDEKGVARIDGTRMKVIHIIREKMARGSSPEQVREAFPHLSLAQIHAALAYYYDHQEEIDAQIERVAKEAESFKRQGGKSALHQKLRKLREEGHGR